MAGYWFEAADPVDLDAWLEEQESREDGAAPIRCAHCDQAVTSADQRTERAGAHAHRFENPAGLVFRIGCFGRAPGCRPEGRTTLAWTWFAGHPWTVALCAGCGTHLGWAYGPGGAGEAFHGLILDRLTGSGQ